MKIHAICLTKNEADVVAECLTEAARWCDRIYVYDGASTDGTWEKVQALASDKIVAWRSDGAVFREGLRAEVFDAFKHEVDEGDWWCQLNADEFYVEDPRAFLSAVPRRHHLVWGVNVQYYLTAEDVQGAPFSGEFRRDRERIRRYRVDCAERRFFRHRRRLHWDWQDAWPRHLGVVHPGLIHYRHYPYRSPQQIQMRLDVRRDNRARGFEGWEHASQETWQEKLAPAEGLHFDAQDGQFIIPEAARRQHLEPAGRTLLKRVLHATGVWP